MALFRVPGRTCEEVLDGQVTKATLPTHCRSTRAAAPAKTAARRRRGGMIVKLVPLVPARQTNGKKTGVRKRERAACPSPPRSIVILRTVFLVFPFPHEGEFDLWTYDWSRHLSQKHYSSAVNNTSSQFTNPGSSVEIQFICK